MKPNADAAGGLLQQPGLQSLRVNDVGVFSVGAGSLQYIPFCFDTSPGLSGPINEAANPVFTKG